MSYIDQVNVYRKLVIGIVYYVSRISILVHGPAFHAQRFKNLGEVAWLTMNLYHTGFQSRQIKYVVYQMQQMV